VRRARTIEELVSDPVDHFYIGTTHLIWCASPSLCGSAHWGRPSEILDEVERLVAQARGIAPVVRALRAYLEGALVDAMVDAAAGALGCSSRTLQRELRQARTSFAAELTRARVRVASMLLSQGDEKVETIARRVGCLSSSRLSVVFKKEMGETPAAYRARHQPPDHGSS
jgi:transcriptional regulator GlxA family with amidase domain